MFLRYAILIYLLCKSNFAFSEYIMIGDSIFVHRGEEIKRTLEISQKIKIRNHAKTGAWMHEVVSQYSKAQKSSGDIIIMDGGGNNILGDSGNCRGNPNDACKSHLKKISLEFKTLLETMEKDGISVVFYLGPYYGSGWNGGNFEAAVDMGSYLMRGACENTMIDCSFIDPRKVMVGNTREWDGVHPNAEGVKILSDIIARSMRRTTRSRF